MTDEENSLATLPTQQSIMPVPAGAGVQAAMRVEIDSQIATARQFPRDVSLSLKKATALATMNKDTAARMFYCLSDGQLKQREGTEIPRGTTSFGPSIRLAEVILSTWGNIRSGAKLIEIADEHVVVVGFAHDMETNVQTAVEHVESILTSKRTRYSDRQILKVAAAAMAKARRNAIFQVVPRVFVDQIQKRCVDIAKGEDKPIVKRWAEIVERFRTQRVTERQVLQLIGRSGMTDMTDDDFAVLESDLAMIVDREATIEQLLKSREAEPPGGNPRMVQE